MEFLYSQENLSLKLIWDGLFLGVCKPRMLKSVSGIDALSYITLKHFTDEVLGFGRDGLPLFIIELKLLVKNILKNSRVVIAFEGRVSTQKDIKDYTQTPDIALFGIIPFKHFRCYVIRGSNYSS